MQVNPHPQRCRSCPVCSESAPLPQLMAARSTVRRASATESGCTAANGSGRSCSCGAQKKDRQTEAGLSKRGCSIKQFHHKLTTVEGGISNVKNYRYTN